MNKQFFKKNRIVLTRLIEAIMLEKGLNWYTIGYANIKKNWQNDKGEFIPFGHATLRRICNDPYYTMMPQKQKKLFDYFGVKYEIDGGDIKVLEVENE